MLKGLLPCVSKPSRLVLVAFLHALACTFNSLLVFIMTLQSTAHPYPATMRSPRQVVSSGSLETWLRWPQGDSAKCNNMLYRFWNRSERESFRRFEMKEMETRFSHLAWMMPTSKTQQNSALGACFPCVLLDSA